MPRGRGRQPGFVMGDEHRDKIRKSNILYALIAHVEGTREMSATQVTAGIALLRKVLPDLAHTELSGGFDVRRAAEATDDELATIAGIAARAAAAGQRDEPPTTH